jgi:hypothetical protein
MASKLAEDFHEVWWATPEFAASREQWSSEAIGRQSALKIEVASRVRPLSERLPDAGIEKEELALLRRAVIDGVITTNYDLLLESIFPEFQVYVGQDELLFSNPQGIGEIYKIHGSCAKPNTLVLTTEDYATFEKRSAYLAAKLLTTFVEHPVVFLGYSLTDPNIQSIIRSIANGLTQKNIEQLRERLIFIQWNPDEPAEISQYTMLIDDFTINVIRIQVPDFLEVFEALAGLSRNFPAKLLRKLKEHIYMLVLHDDPKSQLSVIDLDDADGDDVDIVFGVGIKDRLGRTGYVGLDRWSLIDDVVQEGGQYNAVDVEFDALPHILRLSGNVPTFKYLRQAGFLTKTGSISKRVNIDPRIRVMAEAHRGSKLTGSRITKNTADRLAGVTGIEDLEMKLGVDAVYKFGLFLPTKSIKVDELRSFLTRNRRQLRNADKTQYGKLTCYLDWLEFGSTPEKK